MSQKFETPKQRDARRARNTPAMSGPPHIPFDLLSKRAQRRWACTSFRRVIETHADGELHTVVRGRFDSRFYDRSKYA